MLRFRKLLVNISLKKEYAILSASPSRIARLAGSEELHFLHTAPQVEIPKAVRSGCPWLLRPLKDKGTGRSFPDTMLRR